MLHVRYQELFRLQVRPQELRRLHVRSQELYRQQKRNFESFCVCEFHLRFCHLRLTSDHRPRSSLQSHSRLCVSQHRWLNAIGQKKALPHSLAITRYTHNRDREKSWGRPTCSIFEQFEIRAEPQLILKRTWVVAPTQEINRLPVAVTKISTAFVRLRVFQVAGQDLRSCKDLRSDTWILNVQ